MWRRHRRGRGNLTVEHVLRLDACDLDLTLVCLPAINKPICLSVWAWPQLCGRGLCVISLYCENIMSSPPVMLLLF